jgi:hypothetical protein
MHNLFQRYFSGAFTAQPDPFSAAIATAAAEF